MRGDRGDRPVVPLTMAQEPVWLEQLRHPDRVNAGFFFVTMSGAVRAETVAAACAAVCGRHPELRGTLVDLDGRYLFRINDADEVFEFEQVGLPTAPGAEPAAARAWFLARRPLEWDLTARAPIRFLLLDHGGERRTLVVVVHHIAFDGRSKFVFARQFARALRELREGGGRAVADHVPAVPLADLEDLGEARLGEATRYWLGRDLRAFPSLVLPRPDLLDPMPGMAATPRFGLAEQTFRRLGEVAKQTGTTFFAGLLAATAAELGRYGNDRLALCIPADTSTEATRDRIAMQVNMVPCALEAARGAGFRDLLRAAGRAVSDVDRFRRVPFHLLMRELRRSYGVDVGPGIFDRFGVSYPRVVGDFPEVPGLTLNWDFFAPNSSQSFQITLQLRRTPDGVFGRLDYTTAVFDAATAEEFVGGWCETLERALADPDAPLRPGPVRAGSPAAASAAAEPTDDAVFVPVEQFLPTEERAAFVAAGGRIVLVLEDARAGRVAWGEWDPGSRTPDAALALSRTAPGWRPVVASRDGRELPARTPGVLVLRPTGGGPDLRTGIRARIDGEGRLCYVGLLGQTAEFGGRLLEGGEAERRIAALPGVSAAAVVPGADADDPTPAVLLVPAAAKFDAEAERGWRRRVLRVWPSDAPRPARVVLAGELPRDEASRVDLVRVQELCRERDGPPAVQVP